MTLPTAGRKQLFWWLVIALTVTGCANFDHETPPREFTMPASRMSPDSVALEVAVAELDPWQADEIELLWSELDRQKLPLNTRRLLDLNGLRCAVVPVRTPAVLTRLVEPRPVDRDSLQPWQQEMFDQGMIDPEPRLVLHNSVQKRAGERHPLQTSEVYPQANWIIEDLDSRSAGSGENVRAVWQITPFPNSDGTVRLSLLPQIHHGTPRQQFGVGDQTFMYATGQAVVPLEDMKIETTIRLGESLIVGATHDLAGLGGLFFEMPEAGTHEQAESANPLDAPSEKPGGRQRILLIRLVQTQKNDLFDRNDGKEELISTIAQ
ncbi:MAG: hypothetical protein AAF456_04650 [Planctomycetota bacterium]